MALFYAASRLFDGQPPYGSTREYLRASVGAVALYVFAEGTERLSLAGAMAVGFEVPSVHRAPALSRTLAEFWGRRWNRLVGIWLREHCYAPVARRGRSQLGALAAFGVSALLHVYPTTLAIGVTPALAIGSFFACQGLLVIAERGLGARRWPKLLGRTYVLVAFAATAPLIVEPLPAFAHFVGIVSHFQVDHAPQKASSIR